MTPTFAVVIPLFNKGGYIRAAIDSIAAQTVQPAEIIVVDDGSTDGGLDTVHAMRRPDLRVIVRGEPGPGGYAARNAGILAAKSDWIAFLDADDVWTPDHLRRLADLIAASPAVGCVATSYTHRFETHAYADPLPGNLKDRVRLDLALPDLLAGWAQGRRCPLWTGALAIRRSTLIDVGLFPAGKAVRGGDKDLWLRAVAHAGLSFDPAATAFFTRDSANKVTKTTTTLTAPLILQSLKALDANRDPQVRRLIRQVAAVELFHYIRQSFKQDSVSQIAFSDVPLPEGIRPFAALLALKAIPAPVRQWLYGKARGAAA